MSERTWGGTRVCVAGIGVSGTAAARALLGLGAHVVVVDDRDSEAERATGAELAAHGAEVRLADGETPVDADLVVTSPGWRPHQPLLVAAQAQGIEVIGEPELAWRLRRDRLAAGEQQGPHLLGVTGTNGKTTTVGMLESILRAAGLNAVAAGNVGRPLVDVLLAEPAYDVIAVELSSFQLHWSSTLQFQASAVLNVAEDHLDWHGSMEAYAAAKAKIWHRSAHAVYNGNDTWSKRLSESLTDRHDFAEEPVEVGDIRPPGPHNRANARAAAALARLLDVNCDFQLPDHVVRAGLQGYRPGPHRNVVVDIVGGVTYVDDSKATNPHAAAASLAAYDPVVWVAGGLLKGTSVDDVVAAHAGRLHGVVLLGADRERFREALARHAPDVPVVEVEATDTGAMTAVVHAAAQLAAAGDTVLLAPAAASMDMFRDYGARGDAFAAAVRELGEARA